MRCALAFWEAQLRRWQSHFWLDLVQGTTLDSKLALAFFPSSVCEDANQESTVLSAFELLWGCTDPLSLSLCV